MANQRTQTEERFFSLLHMYLFVVTHPIIKNIGIQFDTMLRAANHFFFLESCQQNWFLSLFVSQILDGEKPHEVDYFLPDAMSLKIRGLFLMPDYPVSFSSVGHS